MSSTSPICSGVHYSRFCRVLFCISLMYIYIQFLCPISECAARVVLAAYELYPKSFLDRGAAPLCCCLGGDMVLYNQRCGCTIVRYLHKEHPQNSLSPNSCSTLVSYTSVHFSWAIWDSCQQSSLFPANHSFISTQTTFIT